MTAAMGKAAASGQAVVRIAAAAAARHLPDQYREALVLQLVDDGDAGVQKVAMMSAPVAMSDALKMRMSSLSKSAPIAPAAKKSTKKAAKNATAKRKKP